MTKSLEQMIRNMKYRENILLFIPIWRSIASSVSQAMTWWVIAYKPMTLFFQLRGGPEVLVLEVLKQWNDRKMKLK